MHILLTGVTGYIGKRLLLALIDKQNTITCCVRDINRVDKSLLNLRFVTFIEVDFLNLSSLKAIPNNIELAYYLIHSMSASTDKFDSMESTCAQNFRDRVSETSVKQVIYLSGISNDQHLSPHLDSRKKVEQVLQHSAYALTTLRAGIIIGSGSASFEIMRDLVEKLPVMVAPKWIETKSQPIAIRNVIEYLLGVLNYAPSFNQVYDIGGPEILTYKQMLLNFSKTRKLRRLIIGLPVMTPKLSSYWLYFVTSTSYKLAINLVDSMKVEVICKPNDLNKELGIELIPYKKAISLAFDKIAQQDVFSSWTDALSSETLLKGIKPLLEVPSFGCLKDKRFHSVENEQNTIQKIWSIGGETGWYYGNFLWRIRGFLDKLVGGVGLRRGRKNKTTIAPGETLDFWRVVYASKTEKRLLLYAEMKLPGEAWLEFKVIQGKLYQVATFRPKGLWGRLYWFSLVPVHHFIFQGMLEKICKE